MEGRSEYFVQMEGTLLDLVNRTVTRPRETLFDPPVPLELVQDDLEKFRGQSSLRIEQAARSCVYRISVYLL
jgi:hypothetical protein